MVKSINKKPGKRGGTGSLRFKKVNHYKKTVLNFPRKRKKTLPKKDALIKFSIVLFAMICFLILGFFIWIGLYLKQLQNSLPEPDKLITRRSDQTTIISDRNGNELYKIYAEQNRKFVKLDDLPNHFKWAILATEDINFYQHGGIDLEAIIKSIYINFIRGEIVRGASTITQQLVKNTLMYDIFGEQAYEQTYTRKIKEILLTIQVEQTLTKDEILQMYVNEVAFGGVNYGIQAASKAYFDKEAKDLTLAESAMLAGTIASPTNFSPIYSTSFDLPTRRQHAVLDLMLRNNYLTGITEEQVEQAKKENLVYPPIRAEIEAPHFVFYVKKELEEIYGDELVKRGGLNVKTTLDLPMQKIAQTEITEGVKKFGHRWGVQNGAMVVIDPDTNEILAMVGSVNYWEDKNPRIDGHVNITTSPRQMGSSVKPYTYLAAFEKGYRPTSILPDKPNLNFGNYRVRNWDNKFLGDITARQALIQSRNIPAVYLLKQIGTGAFVDTVEKFGITTIDRNQYHGLSITLGTAEMTLLEHTAAFSIFANDGIKKPITSILEITDSDGQILYQKKDENKIIFDKKYIDDINFILCDLGNFRDQPQNHLYMINGRRTLCGKTGTTDGPRDLVSILYNKDFVVGVWAGNNNNVATPGAWSTTVSLPISHSFFLKISN